MKSTRFWIGVTGALLLAAALAAAGIWYFGREAVVAEISLDGQVIRTVDLSRVTQGETFVVEGANGTNTVEIEPGRIRVSQADCPDQVCVHQGWISHGGVPIVCLPNRLVIQIRDGDRTGLDSVAG